MPCAGGAGGLPGRQRYAWDERVRVREIPSRHPGLWPGHPGVCWVPGRFHDGGEPLRGAPCDAPGPQAAVRALDGLLADVRAGAQPGAGGAGRGLRPRRDRPHRPAQRHGRRTGSTGPALRWPLGSLCGRPRVLRPGSRRWWRGGGSWPRPGRPCRPGSCGPADQMAPMLRAGLAGLKESAMAAIHDVPAVTCRQAACYRCGRSTEASNIVRGGRHPQDGACIGCAAW